MSISSYSSRKDEIYGYQTYFRECAFYLTTLREQFERALKYFDEALLRTPNDLRALYGRSCTRSKNIQYEGARRDIERALQILPGDLKLLGQKALNIYLSCDFENALIENLHHLPLRKKPDNFEMGVMHCKEAIENSIGIRAGKPLRDHFLIIRKLAWKMAFEAAKPFQPVPRFKKKKKTTATVKKPKVKKLKQNLEQDLKEIKSFLSIDVSALQVGGGGGSEGTSPKSPKGDGPVPWFWDSVDTSSEYGPVHLESTKAADELRDTVYTHSIIDDLIPASKPFPYRPLQRHTTNLSNYMSEKYLGIMYLDKIFLENLTKSPCAKGPNRKGVEEILKMTKHGCKLLKYKQELLRTRRPFYFIKYQEAASSGAMKKRQDEELKRVADIYKREASSILEKIVGAVKEGNTRFVLEMAEKLKCYCDSRSKRVFEDRDKYLRKMYELVCYGHYTLKRLNPKQSDFEQEKRIYVMFGLPISTEPSEDSVIKQYKSTGVVDYKKQIQIYEDRVTNATSNQEKAWLFHELARFNFEMKQLDMARIYCRKCLQEARMCDNPRWMVNAQVLVSRVFILQKNKNEAKIELAASMEIAKALKDHRLQQFLSKCVQVIDKCDFEGPRGSKIIEKREKQILDMLQDSHLKDEAAYLFRQMSVLPASRRMSMMPGIKLNKEGKLGPAGRRMSIKPANKSDDDDDDRVIDPDDPYA